MAGLTKGNDKLGPLIYGWTISAGLTCPGATKACLGVCYAARGHYNWPASKKAHWLNYEASKRDDFVDFMVAEIKKRKVTTLRIHTGGDFYDENYTRKWYDIISKFTSIKFYAYSRSWQNPAIADILEEINGLPNAQMWWSVDRDSLNVPKLRTAKLAYMALDDADAANAPEDSDLIFRVDRTFQRKKMMGIQVCPKESGIKKMEDRLSCSNCGICFRDRGRGLDANLPSLDLWSPDARIHFAEVVTSLADAEGAQKA
jgi:hypothetical protein